VDAPIGSFEQHERLLRFHHPARDNRGVDIKQRVFEHRNVEFAVTVLQFLKGNFLC
jgi:hypothetical protein